MIEEYINTLTTIEIDENVTVIETDRVEIVTISTPGVQGAKGDSITLSVEGSGSVFTDVKSIEVGDNLELTQDGPDSVVITGLPAGVDFFTVEMNGLASTFTAEHNLGRFIAIARVYQPDGEVAQVEVQNKDNAGNVSQNIAQVISSVPMLGKLTLI